MTKAAPFPVFPEIHPGRATLGTVYNILRNTLRVGESFESADLEARRILEVRAGAGWGDLIARPETPIGPDTLAQIESDVRRRLTGEPLSRIYGSRGFGKLEFALSPETLDPRPETETLVEAALGRFKPTPPARILDLGTGSGCILISLLHEWPQTFGIGVDRAFGVCLAARANARKAGVGDRAAFLCGSWGDSLSGRFDLIVSNPPYIRSGDIPNLPDSVKNFDPILALDGGSDGLEALRFVITVIKNRLTQDGRAFVEIGAEQARDSARLVEEAGLNHIGQYPDSSGIPRIVEMSCGDKCKNFLTAS